MRCSALYQSPKSEVWIEYIPDVQHSSSFSSAKTRHKIIASHYSPARIAPQQAAHFFATACWIKLQHSSASSKTCHVSLYPGSAQRFHSHRTGRLTEARPRRPFRIAAARSSPRCRLQQCPSPFGSRPTWPSPGTPCRHRLCFGAVVSPVYYHRFGGGGGGGGSYRKPRGRSASSLR